MYYIKGVKYFFRKTKIHQYTYTVKVRMKWASISASLFDKLQNRHGQSYCKIILVLNHLHRIIRLKRRKVCIKDVMQHNTFNITFNITLEFVTIMCLDKSSWENLFIK